MKRYFNWLAAFLIVATLFGGIWGCKQEIEIPIDYIAPADVTSLTVQAANGNAVLNWKNPADTDFAGVQISMSPAEGTLKNAVSLGKGVVSFDVSGLENGKEYTFTVKTFDESLNYSEGAEEKATVADTADYIAPAEVTELTVQAANGNAVLNWKNPADPDFAGVQVAMSPAEGTLKNAVSLGKGVVSFDVSGLTVGKKYTFTVKAFDKSLNYSEGAEAKATVADTSDKTAPADVTNLTATNKGASVLLTWSDATDEDIYGYEVTWNKNAPINRSAAMEANSMMVAPGAKGCYISNLTNGTEYTFTVKSVDTSGNKSAGVTKTITPSIIEKSALQIALEPNTTERTNKDVVITVNATTDSASKIKKITYVEGTESKIDSVLAGTNITETKKITATENTTFTVAVTDTAGRRELAFITVSNIDKTAPTQVANVIPNYSRNDNAITLSWTNPADTDFAGTEIVYGKTGSEETTTLTFDKNTTSATIENIADDDSEYTIAIKTKDDVGNLSEAEIVTLVASKRATISGVTIPNAGEGYTGELPVTIIGENLIGNVITCNDETFTNITYLSDTKATATITCSGVVGESTITVTSGTSSAIGTVKVVAAENCYSVGDILFTDGTRIKAEKLQYGIPDSQISKAFAVIASAPYGGVVGKAVGLQRSSSALEWAPSYTTGYNTNFTGIQATSSGDSSSGYTFTGDIDGSDNWEYICSIDPEGTKDPATNYPAFNFALTYGTQAGLTETDYENGWYVPSVAELYDVYTNKEVVQTSLNAVGGFTLGTSFYWSSSHHASYIFNAYLVYFYNGDVDYNHKDDDNNVLVLQAFNVEQFNNYSSSSNITSVTIANAGDGYTGELPVTITGTNLKGHAITSNDASFGNVNYVSDTKVTATFVYDGTNNTITVTSGTSKASGTVKVVAAENCYSVGDILFTDGTKIKAENLRYGIPDSQLDKAFAVIASAPYGGGVGKAVGLQKSSSKLQWAPSGTTGYNTKFTGIQADFSGDSSSGYTISGDIDGSDNWEYICSIDPEGTKDAATNYPAFNFALTYGTQAGLTETDYETGWYVPSAEELYDVYTNKEVVQPSLNAVGGFTLGTSNYWSSSQLAFDNDYAYFVFFDGGGVSDSYFKSINNFVFVLQTFNVDQFNTYHGSSITSVTIPNAGEGYTGKLPVTITGTNLKGTAITCSDSSFSNVTYISDTKATATIHYNGSNNTITVTSGTSSATGTVKVVAAEKCFTVGDILFTDGTKIKAENLRNGIPDSQLSKAFAVIASAPYGGGVGKALGLQKSSSKLQWALSGTTGYSTNFTNIVCTPSQTGEGAALTATFTGDTDGGDNWEEICAVDPEGTFDAARYYPAFNFALTYGTTAGLTGTDYENCWYVPSITELCEVYKNKEVVQTSLNAAGGFTLGTSYYWSSSQDASYNGYAYRVDFDDGGVYDDYKDYLYSNVFVLQAFNANQFNNYEYTPSISSVTVANAGEGYTGELPVTIIGENLKYNGITCSDSSFGNVTYISDTKATATITCSGVVGESTITVTSGASSANCTVKVVESEKCFTVGDILFTDGTRIKAENVQYRVSDSQLDKALAVIASAPYGGGVGKAVGLQKSSSTLRWARQFTTGYNTNFTGIQADYSGDSSSVYTFSGDMDGSDNWEYICSIDPEGTKDAANNYPAFNFALTYGTQAGLTGTEYETGWYVPSVAELYDVYTNEEVVQTSLNAVGGFTLGISGYWSSSQHASDYDFAYLVSFNGGYVSDGLKHSDSYVFVLQAFNANQFNDYVLDITPPGDVSNVVAKYSASDNTISVSWINPTDEDFAGIVITYGKKDSEETTTIELANDITSYEIENIPYDDSEYTISLKTKDDVENFGEAKIVTLVASKRATISSVTIANAGEGYTGELPVTIIGENLKGTAITCSDSSFGNVTYISDTKATATFVYNGTNNIITVTSGISSATCTVKVVAAEKCFSVGEVLFTDGTRMKAEKLQYGIPDSQLDKAFAVIASISYGGGVGKAVGLQKSASYLMWASSDTTGYYTNFTGIQGTRTSGDMNGSDNWEYICSIAPVSTKDPANDYPAFNFALTYGTQAGLTGTEYENGWYVPSVAELYDVYTNKEVVQTSLNAAGGFTLGTGRYWSSSQSASSRSAYYVYFYNGNVDYYGKDNDDGVFVLQAFNAEQFNNYEVTTIPSITSVTIPHAGEGYTGELPVTIIGENLKGYVITCSDLSFGNVTYISDTKATATIHYDGSNNTITVTSGISSASGTVKVVAAENCFSVGDILFTDGTRIKAKNVKYGIPDSQLSKAFAVITSVSYGGGVGKAVGLQKSASELVWAPSGTRGYSTNFTRIQADYSGDSSSGYTFTGDMDGSDNWEYICSIDPEGTKDAATNYPAFNFALTYGTQAGLTGTEYETGWYVPSVAELYDVYTMYSNKKVVQKSLNAAGGYTLGTSYYWSSSQDDFYSSIAYFVNFDDGSVGGPSKYGNYNVLVLQAFNAEQFNNYEVTTIPSITSVTVANAGEGYTGKLLVTIIGENLKGHAITSNDASFGNVTNLSDTKATATITCSGVVGESTITVTSGTSSATGTVKVVAAEKCYSVGDILFTDGTRMKAENVQYGLPSGKNAFAVIASAPYGGGVGKAVGLQKSAGTLMWAPSGTTGYSTKFTEIQVTPSYSTSSGYTFSGDIDGSDNWKYICSIDPEGTKDPANNYPAFNFALIYGTQAGLTETEYENGWYVPSVAELYDVYTNKEDVQTSLNAVGGFTLGGHYWSSSQVADASGDNHAIEMYFDDDVLIGIIKNYYINVFVLQAFNAGQFN